MTCPKCNSAVIRNKGAVDRDDHIVRYKVCLKCGYKWKTVEMDEDMICKKGYDKDAED